MSKRDPVILLLLDSRGLAPQAVNRDQWQGWIAQSQAATVPVIWLQHPDVCFHSLPQAWRQRSTPMALQQDLAQTGATHVVYVPLAHVPLAHVPLAHVPLASEPWPLGSPLSGVNLSDRPLIAPWIPRVSFPRETATAREQPITCWVATCEVLCPHIPALFPHTPWSLLALAQRLEAEAQSFSWGAIAPQEKGICRYDRLGQGQGQGKKPSTHLVLIPHFRCEPWLARCLGAITHQTHAPDGIVVIDDGSPQPPIEIVSAFPQVTLLQSASQVGPYRLIQQVIETTAYDWYVFQDADDWPTQDRLARLFNAAERTGAALVGSQEIRVDATTDQLYPVTYPLDASQALAVKPGHPLLHPTSMVARSLVMALGGFATGLRFGGDTEFLLRAAWVAQLVNVPDFCYFRQKRPQSLTTDPETGLASPARQRLLHQVKSRAMANQRRVAQGRSPLLTPLSRRPGVPLRHCCGPYL